MLRIAVPNKGALSNASIQMLIEAGYRQRRTDRDLTATDDRNNAQFFYLRPKDIATYVASGDLDAGFTGRDLLHESGAHATETLALGFGGSTFRYAAPSDTMTDVTDLKNKRVATSFPKLVTDNLAQHDITATVIALDGAVENAVGLGVADAVADVVSTGATLRQAGLSTFGDPIITSEAILITRQPTTTQHESFVRRLHSVLVARRYVMLAYDVHAEALDRAVNLTPGIESPTISPLHREGWVAVESMTPRDDVHHIMDQLYDIGARGILVTNIHACRI